MLEKIKIKKFDEEKFYSLYVKKEVLEQSSFKRLGKFVGSCVSNLFYLPILIIAFLSFADLCNLYLPLFSIFLSYSIFLFLCEINSTFKLIRRMKKLDIFKDQKYILKKIYINSLLLAFAIIFEVFINLTPIMFNFEQYMIVKILFTFLIYWPLICYLYERTNQEVIVGIGKVHTRKEARADNLKKTLEEKKASGIGPLALRDELTEENNDEPF